MKVGQHYRNRQYQPALHAVVSSVSEDGLVTLVKKTGKNDVMGVGDQELLAECGWEYTGFVDKKK